jgi:hypothetical protein
MNLIESINHFSSLPMHVDLKLDPAPRSPAPYRRAAVPASRPRAFWDREMTRVTI